MKERTGKNYKIIKRNKKKTLLNSNINDNREKPGTIKNSNI
jgi:hypothetical protein